MKQFQFITPAFVFTFILNIQNKQVIVEKKKKQIIILSQSLYDPFGSYVNDITI